MEESGGPENVRVSLDQKKENDDIFERQDVEDDSGEATK